MSELIIRHAEPAEYDHIAQLLLLAYAPGREGGNSMYYEWIQDVQGRAKDGELLVASIDDQVVGTVTWCPPASPLQDIAHEHEGEIRLLGVHPDAAGHGVGRALVQACIACGRQAKLRAIVLLTREWMVRAHHIYESEGFVRIPDRDMVPHPGIVLWAYRLVL
ncbi:GNAT family N-acetyltransferase [Stomatohabitans albus]|uniref:GNAT family N-acetyltransferase n=1 Tax=Stomatohabitans albus TaxID=3110766 RepID=UPI00300C5DCB